MATFDECLDKQPPNVRLAINAVVDRAGTYDADWQVLQAAGEIIADLWRRNTELTARENGYDHH